MVAAEGWVVLGRGQLNLQPAGLEAAPARPDQQEEGGKVGYRERVNPDGAAAGNEETVDVPRHSHAAVGRDEWQPGHRRQVGSAAGGLESRGYVGGAEGG